MESGGAGTQTVELNGEPTIAVGLPITALDAAYFELGSLADIESTLSSLARALLLAGLVATLLGAALGAALGSVILQPLRRFAQVAQRISAGESSSRLDAAGDADLEPLATSFNEMLDELDERIERERRFASDVSHEIRGPVAALASAVSIVDRRRDQLPDEVVPVVDALQEQVTAFNQLVLDLLEISRFDARTARLELVPIDLGALCRRLVTERGFDSVALHVPDPSPAVLADRRRIEQVLFNLLDNARLYAGGATDLVLVAGERSAAIEVMDRGPGLIDGELDDVFERFQRGSAADSAGAPGTGLGLALSRQHIALHGGSLRVANREGGGAVFTVELPGDRIDGFGPDGVAGRTRRVGRGHGSAELRPGRDDLRMTLRRAVIGLALAAGVLLGACGVPLDDEAGELSEDEVPFDLLSATTTSLAPATPVDAETTVCLEFGGMLLSLGRDRSGDPPLDDDLALLGAGPTEGEAEIGARSLLDGDDAVLDVDRSAGTATVQLGPDVAELSADQQLLAVAQAVCTLTAQPGVDDVAFEIEGRGVEVPIQGGELVRRPVTIADYLTFVAN